MDAQNGAAGAELEGVRVTRWTPRSERRPSREPGRTDRRKSEKQETVSCPGARGRRGRMLGRPSAFHLCSCAGELRASPCVLAHPGAALPGRAPAGGLCQPVYFQWSRPGSALAARARGRARVYSLYIHWWCACWFVRLEFLYDVLSPNTTACFWTCFSTSVLTDHRVPARLRASPAAGSEWFPLPLERKAAPRVAVPHGVPAPEVLPAPPLPGPELAALGSGARGSRDARPAAAPQTSGNVGSGRESSSSRSGWTGGSAMPAPGDPPS